MIYSGAVVGEQCALCRCTMNLGASICARCGATRRVVGEGALGLLGQLMIPLSMLTTIVGIMWVTMVGATYGWFSQLAFCGWAVLILPPCLAVILVRFGTGKVKYFLPNEFLAALPPDSPRDLSVLPSCMAKLPSWHGQRRAAGADSTRLVG